MTVSAKGAETIKYTINGTETTVSGESADVTLPETPGEYTLSVTATNEVGSTSGSATYKVVIPAPGDITFDPASGVVNAGQTISITSEGATTLKYTVNDGEETTVNGDNASVTLPEDAGSYTVAVTASNAGGETTGEATYTIIAEVTADPFELVTKASQLKEGMHIVIGDPNNDPQTVMSMYGTNNNMNAYETTIEDNTVSNVAEAQIITLVAGSNGGWILQDASYPTYYLHANGYNLTVSTNPSEFTIDIDENGLAKISWDYIIGGQNYGTYFINHNKYSTSGVSVLGVYDMRTENQISETNHRYYPYIYAQGIEDPVVDAPGEVTFNPAAGEVEANTTVTITSEGATSITYIYNGESTTVAGETAEVVITVEGTVEVTAKNEGGETTGSAAYTIKASTPAENVIATTLDQSSTTCNWIFEKDNVTALSSWSWMETGRANVLSAYGDAETAYDPTPYTLPTGNIIITATFDQNQGINGAKFLIRENETEEWTELPITTAASRAASVGKATLTDYKGQTVQIGLLYPGGEEWQVNNLTLSSRIRTAIDEVSVEDTNAPAVYYNLQGMRVNAESLTPGIYVRVQGKTTTKVLVK